MTCDRCKDIHEGQKLGKVLDSCRCSCHNTFSFELNTNNQFTFPNGGTVDPQWINCSCGAHYLNGSHNCCTD